MSRLISVKKFQWLPAKYLTHLAIRVIRVIKSVFTNPLTHLILIGPVHFRLRVLGAFDFDSIFIEYYVNVSK